MGIKQFLYFHFGSVALADGRSLRHKYFKDYKDYLGKWGNGEILENLRCRSINSTDLHDVMVTPLLAGSSSNNAVGYEKQHHKHLG